MWPITGARALARTDTKKTSGPNEVNCVSALLARLALLAIASVPFAGPFGISPIFAAEESALPQPVSVDRLLDGTENERWQATLDLHRMDLDRLRETASDKKIVGALAKIIADPSLGERLRTAAANAVFKIGPPAAPASDACIDMMLEPGLELADVAAYAWGALKVAPSERMLAILRDPHSHRFVSTVAKALGASRDPRSAQPIIDALGKLDDKYDDRFSALTQALGDLSSAAAPALISALKGASVVQKEGIAAALGSMFSAGKSDPLPELTDVLLDLLDAGQEAGVRMAAAQAARSIRIPDPRMVDRLLQIVGSDDTEAVRSSAAEALVTGRSADRRIAPTLVEAIAGGNGGEVIDMLRDLHAIPVEQLVARIQRTNDADARARLVKALAAAGSAAAGSLPDIVKDLSGTEDQLTAATNALPDLGPTALSAVPVLVESLARETDPYRKRLLAGALAAVAPFVLAELPPGLRGWERALKHDFSRALPIIEALRESDDDESFSTTYVTPVQQAITHLTAKEFGSYALWSAVAVSLVLFVGLTWSLSWQLRRRTLILLGQRWTFAVGRCDYGVDITGTETKQRLVMRALSGDARSDVMALDLHAVDWAAVPQLVLPAKKAMSPRALVRIETDKAIFGRPWSSAIGDGWSRPDATIAGQICAANTLSELAPRRSRRIAFSGLGCAISQGGLNLPSATAEVRAVRQVFQDWGADTEVPHSDAAITDMALALENSDVVHAAVHASSLGLYLRDGVFDAEALQGRSLRCRLLVLSACDAGDVSLPEAFLWSALTRGINVVAALTPVDDQVCRVFFSDFYSALLPSRRSAGRSLAEAIRIGAASCRRRFDHASERLGDAQLALPSKRTLDAFVLYGDPSISLQLR
jgi:CHAT domain/HEAT repeats